MTDKDHDMIWYWDRNDKEEPHNHHADMLPEGLAPRTSITADSSKLSSPVSPMFEFYSNVSSNDTPANKRPRMDAMSLLSDAAMMSSDSNTLQILHRPSYQPSTQFKLAPISPPSRSSSPFKVAVTGEKP